ncbi:MULTISPECIES: methylcobamide:CoM methyltransferase MtbA [Clostridium]|uniref:methylcobamide:CoM methyltransferase MtbA n=1 Tax=Clostridium TaxID=1485 RepID=UPI00174E7AF5|nr:MULTISPECIES: methylcobamide:CoM methyltransferase MtbA [Clostridium]EKS4342307.1 MtaA/CmuA family methyltransferase [Clostridium botulinum]EKS4393774.1 MtaA/CmuA family methyltransferase [Clostridium botulinum]MBD5639938.1 MtaA/CmuA family methyltransferase [Clostridium botulinum]MCW6080390.1 MtaA/CmuA family methyltransferase [Clostridium sporogenes]
MLTPKERLNLVLKNKEVDRPPCICPGGMMNMIIEDLMDISGFKWPEAHVNPEIMANLAISMYEQGGFENFGVPFCMTIEAEAMGATVDLGDKTTEPRVIKYPIESVEQWRQLKKINLNEGREKVVLDAIKIIKDRNLPVPIMANLTGPISVASSLMEPMYFYKELVRKKDEAHKFINFVTENLIEFGKAQLLAGANVITISDPSGTGEILGPRLFKEFVIPYLNRIVDELKDYTDGTIIHICGRLKSIYKELNDLHSDVVSFDSISSVTQVLKNVQNKAVMGNVSTLTIQNSTKEEVEKLANACMNLGVDILSPACGIGTKSPIENVRAMVDAAKKRNVK